MIASVLLVAFFLGLAAWVPPAGSEGRHWLGLRLTLAVAGADLALFLLGYLGGLPLTWACRLLAVAAGAGWIMLAIKAGAGQARPRRWQAVFHPVAVLPALMLAVLAVHGTAPYLPAGWDEYSNWFNWAREMVLQDSMRAVGIGDPVAGYTPGLPVLMALPSVLLGRFDEAHSASLQFIMHVGLLGMVYDLARASLEKRAPSPLAAALSAWLVVLAVLAVEAAWKLYPNLQLMEKPQIYAYGAFALMMILGARTPIRPISFAAQAGVLLAYAYLLKLATLVFVPTAALLALVPLAREDRRIRLAMVMALPMAVAVLAWKVAGSHDPSNFNSLLPVLELLLQWGPERFLARMHQVAADFVPTVGQYILGFKPWLTGLALVGYALAWRRSEGRWALVALALFLLLTEVLLYVFHLKWLNYLELNSYDRFTRVPLRPFQLVGLIFALLAVAEWGLPRLRPRLVALLALPIAGLLALQAVQIERSLTEMGERAGRGAMLREVAVQSQRMAVLMRERGLAGGPVRMIDQGADGFWQKIAYYRSRNMEGTGGRDLYQVRYEYSFGDTVGNAWRIVVDRETFARTLAAETVVWPVTMDAWMAAILAPLVEDAACRADPTGYFLFRRPQGGFECVAKRP